MKKTVHSYTTINSTTTNNTITAINNAIPLTGGARDQGRGLQLRDRALSRRGDGLGHQLHPRSGEKDTGHAGRGRDGRSRSRECDLCHVVFGTVSSAVYSMSCSTVYGTEYGTVCRTVYIYI